MRLPIEWQRMKEEAFAHPCLLAVCLTGWPALHGLSFCLSILAGELLTSWAFRFIVRHFMSSSVMTSLGQGDLLPSMEAKLAGNYWHLGLLGVATAVPPATVITAIALLQLGGELSLRRMKWAFIAQSAATLWALGSILLLLRLCSHWNYASCTEVEKKDDLICQKQEQKAIQKALLSLACHFETTFECEVVFGILCCYTFGALVTLLGSLLGLYGVKRLQQHCCQSTGRSAKSTETHALLSEMAMACQSNKA